MLFLYIFLLKKKWVLVFVILQKKSGIWETNHLLTDARQFYTLQRHFLVYLRPLLSNTFPQWFQKSKKVEHWTLVSRGKKTFKQSEQMKKKNPLKYCFAVQFYILYEQHFSNLRPLLSITFPKGFQKFKSFDDVPKKNWVRNTYTVGGSEAPIGQRLRMFATARPPGGK